MKILEATMTKKQKAEYAEADELRTFLEKNLAKKKFKLDCGHHVTFSYFLGNDITIYNGKKFRIICSQCGY
jgi:hypothetical protein